MPSLSTVAIFLSADFQVTLCLAVAGETVARRASVSSTQIAAALPWSMVTLTGTVGSTTFSVSTKLFFLDSFMVILTLPGFFGVTRPALLTVAIFFELDL